MQRGFPQTLPGGDRGVRSAIPDRRRRRGRMLAAEGGWRAVGLQRRRHGRAPPPKLGAHLLEAADRLGPGRSDAGAEGAREVQRPRARALDRSHLWQRPDLCSPVAPGARLPRHLGRRALSVPLRASPEPARFAATDAGMVSDDRHAGGIVGVELRLEPNQALAARAGHRGPAATDAGLRERHARFLPKYAEPPWGPDEAAVVYPRPPPPPAPCSPARARPAGPPSPALRRHGTT